MFIPKLKIKYGSRLDQDRRNLYAEKQFGEYPDQATILKELSDLRSLWENLNSNDRVIKQIIEITGVQYPEDLYAYVIGAGFTAMSKPFLIPLRKRNGETYIKKELTELLVHEVIHNFVGDLEMSPHLKRYWDLIREEYVGEAIKTQNHLIVYAVLEVVLSELFGEENLASYINPQWPDYIRAWEIVQEKGSDNLIEEFRKYSLK